LSWPSSLPPPGDNHDDSCNRKEGHDSGGGDNDNHNHGGGYNGGHGGDNDSYGDDKWLIKIF